MLPVKERERLLGTFPAVLTGLPYREDEPDLGLPGQKYCLPSEPKLDAPW